MTPRPIPAGLTAGCSSRGSSEAMPRPVSLTSPVTGSTSTLSGLRSLCRTPWRCSSPTAAVTAMASASTRSGSSRSAMKWRRGTPPKSSSTSADAPHHARGPPADPLERQGAQGGGGPEPGGDLVLVLELLDGPRIPVLAVDGDLQQDGLAPLTPQRAVQRPPRRLLDLLQELVHVRLRP